jgi:hypothetical protein
MVNEYQPNLHSSQSWGNDPEYAAMVLKLKKILNSDLMPLDEPAETGVEMKVKKKSKKKSKGH